MNKFIKTLMAGCMVLGLAACGSNDTASADAFKIGGSGPTTGDYAIYGLAVQHGAEIAVEELNAKGGIQLSLQFEDDKGEPELATNAYGTLKDNGMQIGLSTTTSGAGAAVSSLYQKDNIFAITPSASNTAVVFTDDACKNAYGNIFQMCFTDPNQGVASADYISQHKDLGTKVGIIYQSDENYSKSIYKKFVEKAKTVGLSIVATETFTKDDKDFNTQLKSLQSKGADVMFLPTYYSANALILTQASKMGYQPSVFGVDGMDGILGVEGFDTKLAEGVYLLTPFSADAADDLTANFVAKYKEKFNEVPNQFAADAYDSVYAIYNALTEAKATPDMSAEEICKILTAQFTSMTFNGVTGNDVTWKATGEVSKAPKAVIVKDGAYAGVED